MGFDWNANCSYDAENKAKFHREARKRLKQLAETMGFPPSSYDLRSNKGGIAVSGEVTLHHDRVYIQASQPVMGRDTGLMIRTCEGRKDYSGGHNNFAPLSSLEDPQALADRVKRIQPALETRTIEEIEEQEAGLPAP